MAESGSRLCFSGPALTFKPGDIHGQTPLHVAANENENVGVVTLLLEAGADVRARDGSGRHPVWEAATNPNSEVLATLIRAGGDLHATGGSKGYSPLMVASQWNSNPDVVEALLDAGAVVPGSRFQRGEILAGAMRLRSVPLMRRLLDAGVGANERNGQGETPLHTAVRLNDADLVATILKVGASVHAIDSRGRTPLVAASFRRSPRDPLDVVGRGRRGRFQGQVRHVRTAARSPGIRPVFEVLAAAGGNAALRDEAGSYPAAPCGCLGVRVPICSRNLLRERPEGRSRQGCGRKGPPLHLAAQWKRRSRDRDGVCCRPAPRWMHGTVRAARPLHLAAGKLGFGWRVDSRAARGLAPRCGREGPSMAVRRSQNRRHAPGTRSSTAIGCPPPPCFPQGRLRVSG